MRGTAFLQLAMLAATTAVWASDSATIRLEASPENVQVGGLIKVTMTIDTDEFVNLGDVVLTYDPSVFRAARVDSAGSRFSFDGVEDLQRAAGRVHVLRGEPHPSVPKGNGLLFCSVYFRALAAATVTEIGVVFAGPGAEGDSAVYKDDGVPTDILTTVIPATVEVSLPAPRSPSGRVQP